MPETVAPPVAKLSLDATRKAATVSASPLALHSLQPRYIGKLEAEGVIQRQGGRFHARQERVAYLRYLRPRAEQSPRRRGRGCSRRGQTEHAAGCA